MPLPQRLSLPGDMRCQHHSPSWQGTVSVEGSKWRKMVGNKCLRRRCQKSQFPSLPGRSVAARRLGTAFTSLGVKFPHL